MVRRSPTATSVEHVAWQVPRREGPWFGAAATPRRGIRAPRARGSIGRGGGASAGSARGRRYRFLVLESPVRPSLESGLSGWVFRALDGEAMRRAAAHLLGEHDFSAFRAVECQAKSPVKTLRRAELARHGDLLVFDFEASAFLHHMVRNLVGTLVYVGKGAHPPAWVGEILAGRDRSRAAPTFDACGLYFAGVDYDPVWQLKVGAGDTAQLLP